MNRKDCIIALYYVFVMLGYAKLILQNLRKKRPRRRYTKK